MIEHRRAGLTSFPSPTPSNRVSDDLPPYVPVSARELNAILRLGQLARSGGADLMW
jgi:hypothetical protein